MTIYGYARVSTGKQDTDAQRRALEAAGCHEIMKEQASGRRHRPALSNLIGRLQAGDVVTVWKISRIARDVRDFHQTLQRITDAGAELRSISESIDTGTPIGRAMLGFLAVMAQLEAEQISENVKSGLDAARQRGRLLGRRRALSPEAETEVRGKLAEGQPVKVLARHYRVSPSTVRRIRATS